MDYISQRFHYRPIAAFLGLFGMTVEETLDAFFKLYTTVFADDRDPAVTRAPKGEVSIKTDRSETRASRLEAALKELMKSQKYGIPENAMLSDAVFRSNPCKVYVEIIKGRNLHSISM